ncbi:MAG: type II toxin-antitoxin system YoeB family toxin [Peptococcaceae bacterium]|nr:type II toxin-antitoxin system YoeB family toxin [Peptococcaceae bacterium]
MTKLWTDKAWGDYLYWQSQDKKTLKRVNQLLQDIERNGNDGIGKPEALSGDSNIRGSFKIGLRNTTALFADISTRSRG